MREFKRNMLFPFNVYTSREDQQGYSGTITSPLYLVLLIYLMALLNAALWGGIGIYQAITVIV